MTSNTSPSSISSSLNAALSLDIQVLSLLLKRNHDQQHRCIYYRRLTMVQLALRRAASSLDWTIIDEMERLSNLVERQIKEDADNKSVSPRKRRLKEEQWTIQRDEGHDTIKIIDNHHNSSSPNNNNNNTNNIIQLIQTLQTIHTLTTQQLPQLTSRIIHATSPILHELSRGYFVPFLTVALACLARIHVLVLRLGRECVGRLSQCLPRLRECVDDYLVNNKRSDDGSVDVMTKLKEAIWNFGVDDWNELMKPFSEISHDDITKKMNAFVKERRWKDAVIALGIKEKDLKGMQQTTEQSNDVNDVNEHDVNGSNNDDMGELVYMDQDHDTDGNDTKRKSGSNGVDDNMARVLNKRKLEDVAPTQAKKRRRRKKKKKCVADNDAEIDQKINQKIDDAVENTGISSNDDGADNTEKAQNEGAEAAYDVDDLPSQQSKLPSEAEPPNEGDEVLLDAERSDRETKSDIKKMKKSKKKKTKKKKSRNVIDDIFG